jgi:membrane-associated phospholipid phosphatase
MSQWIATGTMGLGVVAGHMTLSDPDDARWQGPVFLDYGARSSLRFGSDGARSAADTVSDVLLYALVSYPLVIDTGLVAWGIHDSPDVASQMFAITSQAYTLTYFVTMITKHAVARERPYGQQCESGETEEGCGPNRYRSFISGHSAMAFTAAGLICAHHENIPLYGGGDADAAACPIALTAATSVAALRMAADRHYLSDVLMGAAVGLLSGYFLPSWLHFDIGEEDDNGVPSGGRVSPAAGLDSFGLTYHRIF